MFIDYVKAEEFHVESKKTMLVTVEKWLSAVLPYSILMPPRLPDICHCYKVWLNLVSWHENICLTKRRRHLFFRRIQDGFVVLYHKELNTA